MIQTNRFQELIQIASESRLLALEAMYHCGSGHPGSAFSTIDILVALFFGGGIKYRANNPNWKGRDYFLLSNGHAVPALYAVLAKAGYFPEAEMKGLRKLGFGAQGHPHAAVFENPGDRPGGEYELLPLPGHR